MAGVIPIHSSSVGSSSGSGVRWVGSGIVYHVHCEINIEGAVTGGVGNSVKQELEVIVYLSKC